MDKATVWLKSQVQTHSKGLNQGTYICYCVYSSTCHSTLCSNTLVKIYYMKQTFRLLYSCLPQSKIWQQWRRARINMQKRGSGKMTIKRGMRTNKRWKRGSGNMTGMCDWTGNKGRDKKSDRVYEQQPPTLIRSTCRISYHTPAGWLLHLCSKCPPKSEWRMPPAQRESANHGLLRELWHQPSRRGGHSFMHVQPELNN